MFCYYYFLNLSSRNMSNLIPPLPATGRLLPNKVVIRLLPPLITEAELELPTDCFEYKEFVQGQRPEKPCPSNPTVNARMYVQCKSFEYACDLIAKYHGRVFKDDKGEAFRAVACFAPNQRVPKPGRQLVNNLDGTIEHDEHFVNFIENGPENFSPQEPVATVEKKMAPLVAAIAERNRRLNDQIEHQRENAKGKSTSSAKMAVNAAPKVKAKPKSKDKTKDEKEKEKVKIQKAPVVIKRSSGASTKPTQFRSC